MHDRLRLVAAGLVACLILVGTGIVVAKQFVHPGDDQQATHTPASTTNPVVLPEPPANCAAVACVALTFDDGPGPYTADLLDVLDEKNAKATFFVLGSRASRNRDLLARTAASGHAIGNHSWSHKDLTKISRDTIDDELDRTTAAIVQVTGADPVLMRPPYGTLSDSVRAAAGDHGTALVLWDVDTEDWKNRDPQITTQRALEATDGSIILMHDIHESTLVAMPGIIDGLRAAGFTLVTVPELLETLNPGQVYWNRSDEVGSTQPYDASDPADEQVCWAPLPDSTPPEPGREP